MVILALTYDGSLLTVINASMLLRLLPKLFPVRKPRFVNQSLTLNADTFCCRILSLTVIPTIVPQSTTSPACGV